MQATSNRLNGAVKPERITIDLNDPTLAAWGEITVKIQSTAPLMQQRFSKKAEILGKHTGETVKSKKPNKNPEQDMLDSLHIIGARPKTIEAAAKARIGIPAVAFKMAMIRGASICGGKMTEAKTSIFVNSTADDLVEIVCDDAPELDTRPTRNATGVIDIRCRPLIRSWHATLTIRYNHLQVNYKNVISWLINAGIGCGVGELRPFGKESTGDYGTWKVVSAEAEIPQGVKANG
jgi:hypothetical protein